MKHWKASASGTPSRGHGGSGLGSSGTGPRGGGAPGALPHPHGACRAEIAGKLRYSLEERADFPTVGDWVAAALLEPDRALIHHLLPRQTALYRRAASHQLVKQVIGANIDIALVVQAVEGDFNLNRLDRYLAAAHGGGIRPVVVLNKSDLLLPGAVDALEREILVRHPGQGVIRTSRLETGGLENLRAFLEVRKTHCVLGSSGVGKSTLINGVLGAEELENQAISGWNQRGKHTTTHRALFVVPAGGTLIDTPGMRELGPTDELEGIERTFFDIVSLAGNCCFSDCRHKDEPGCAILAALESGSLDPKKLENYEKLRGKPPTMRPRRQRNARSPGATVSSTSGY